MVRPQSLTLALALTLALPLAAEAHIGYGGRDFGRFDAAGGIVTIANQTVSGNYGWADGLDADVIERERGHYSWTLRPVFCTKALQRSNCSRASRKDRPTRSAEPDCAAGEAERPGSRGNSSTLIGRVESDGDRIRMRSTRLRS